MKLVCFVFILAAVCPAAGEYSFSVSKGGETVVEIDMSSPNSDWAIAGREAAVAAVRVDDGPEQHVVAWAGPALYTYRVFAGPLTPGQHRLTIMRDDKQSAKGSALKVGAVRFRESSGSEAQLLAHAPVLYARANTVGKFSDVPLLMYCERDGETLVYTVVFSNEDGGTSTRALMARWGRTTDIEYVYRVFLNPDGSRKSAIVQGPDHKDLEFTGPYAGFHPILMPVTNNNMVAAGKNTGMRFQLAPELVSLSGSSREAVMDAHPATYEAMAKELEREGKLRPFGTVNGQTISDVRNYLFIEYQATHDDSALTALVALKDDRLFSGDIGRAEYAIGREGWVRTTVELPPRVRPGQIAAIGFQCIVAPSSGRARSPVSGVCRLEQVRLAFFLDRRYRPGKPLFSIPRSFTIPAGQSILLRP